MQISEADWIDYKNKLAAISDEAAKKLETWLTWKGGYQNVERGDLIAMAYGLITKYSEASASLAAEMYDEIATISGATVPAAEVADSATYGEVAKAINGVTKIVTTDSNLGNVVARYVKRAGADTTLKNAERDGAQFAWIPAGDTCAFCLTLASNGWQYQSKNAMKNGHASHIHANCDCTYAVRFDNKTNVKGYNPEKYREMYYNAEGKTPQERINSMRRIHYQENRDKILAQKKANYEEKHKLVQTGGKITGGHHYDVNKNEGQKGILAAKQYEKYAKIDDSKQIAQNTGFSVEDIQKIRSHVFYEKHDLDDGFKRFEPDYDMAVAWKRLQEGNFLPRDITLLNHELLESKIEKEYNISAREAHEITQKTYNWVKQLMKETDGKGEQDGLL